MPAPSGTFQRPDLGTAMSQFPAYMAKGYVATQVLPVLSVALQSANYSVIEAESMLMLEDLRRTPGAGYKRADYKFVQDSYSTEEYGLEEAIDDRQRKIYAHSIDAELHARDRLMLRLMTNLEVTVAAQAQNTAVITGTAAVAQKWNDVASCAPIDDVRAALIALRGQCGFDPSEVCMVIDWELFQFLRSCEQILDRVKYSGEQAVTTRKISREAVAAALDIGELIVAGGMKNTANKGQTRSLSQIWDKTKATLFFKATNDIQFPGLGHTVAWSEDGASPEGVFEEYREEQNRSQIIRCRAEFKPKIKYAKTGYILTGCYA